MTQFFNPQKLYGRDKPLPRWYTGELEISSSITVVTDPTILRACLSFQKMSV